MECEQEGVFDCNEVDRDARGILFCSVKNKSDQKDYFLQTFAIPFLFVDFFFLKTTGWINESA